MKPRTLIGRFLALSTVTFLTACGGGGGGGTASDSETTYEVTGTVTGLDGMLVLQNNGAGNFSVDGNVTFVLVGRAADGYSYDLSIVTQPDGQTCVVSNGVGTVNGADVSDISVTCEYNTVAFSSVAVADGSAPKRIEFSWVVDDASNVDEFVLLENADGSSGFTEVARADGSATSLEYELSVHLTVTSHFNQTALVLSKLSVHLVHSIH